MMVKPAALSIGIAAMACALCGCAGTPTTAASGTASAEEIKVYDPGQLIQGRYDLVKRLWVDSWHSATWLPAQASAANGIGALRIQAQHLGANALIDVACYDQGYAIVDWGKEPSFVCYGNAIRVH